MSELSSLPQERDLVDPLYDAEDALGSGDEVVPFEYTISSYGADYPVEVLISRLEAGDIFIPPFQRGYVWPLRIASRFIDSLLLGLPVPGIFLARESGTNKNLVIDGQQRLSTLRFFHDGIFSETGKEFKLEGLSSRFNGLTYRSLADSDRRKLDDTIIHATIVRQEDPDEAGQSSVFHLFERLNSGAKTLAPHEVRRSIFHGPFADLLAELNQDPLWRKHYGDKSPVLRDQELILRFLAFLYYGGDYVAPMKTFLNRYMGRNRDLSRQSDSQIRHDFGHTLALIDTAIGSRAFRPVKAFNAAVFDSVMVGVAKSSTGLSSEEAIRIHRNYMALLQNDQYKRGIERATANEQRVTDRMSAALAQFSSTQ